MIDEIASYRMGGIDLRTLVQRLQGLMGASDLHDGNLIDEFWSRQAPIDMELELRTEPWAPPGSASDIALQTALDDFVTWVQMILATTDDNRT